MDQGLLITCFLLVLSFFSLIALSRRFQPITIIDDGIIKPLITEMLQVKGEMSLLELCRHFDDTHPEVCSSAQIVYALMQLVGDGSVNFRIQIDPDGHTRRYYRSAHKEMESVS